MQEKDFFRQIHDLQLKDIENMYTKGISEVRILADVQVDGVSLGEELIKKGLAKPYDGGTKSGW